MAEVESGNPLEDKDRLNLVHLINKEMRGGLAQEEEEKKAYLIEVFKSGK